MRLTHLELVYLNERRKKANCGWAEQELIRREMHGSMNKLKGATDQFLAIESAMAPETRVALWHLVDADDGTKWGRRRSGIMFDDNNEGEDPPCDICGKPSCLVLDTDTDNPTYFCDDHLPESWSAVFRETGPQPMGPCVVCGVPGEVRIIDMSTTSLKTTAASTSRRWMVPRKS
jgi:hypothetical protein